MSQNEKINYIELPTKDIKTTKNFFSKVFNWSFVDYGEEYVAFNENCGLEGGFYKINSLISIQKEKPLIIFYSKNLEETQLKITKAGGKIVKPIFNFPGGYRFHFTDPSGNEYAVWSETTTNE